MEEWDKQQEKEKKAEEELQKQQLALFSLWFLYQSFSPSLSDNVSPFF